MVPALEPALPVVNTADRGNAATPWGFFKTPTIPLGLLPHTAEIHSEVTKCVSSSTGMTTPPPPHTHPPLVPLQPVLVNWPGAAL